MGLIWPIVPMGQYHRRETTPRPTNVLSLNTLNLSPALSVKSGSSKELSEITRTGAITSCTGNFTSCTGAITSRTSTRT